MKHSQHAIKRLIDVVVAGLGLALLVPLMGLVACLIRWTAGQPVLFRQVRPGRGAKPFVLYKFRTMHDGRDRQGRLLPDADRLTRVGRWLRKTSLDELPQLWNVLRGDMSLIGPRPLLTEYLRWYTPEQHRRHDVRPGITGWAQVNGRQTIAFSRRLELDVWYVDHFSLWLDLVILGKTVHGVMGSRGVILEQSLSEVDDLGLSRDLDSASSQSPTARPEPERKAA